MRSTDSIVAEQVERWRLDQARAGRLPARRSPVIAISREYGAQGAAVAHLVAEQLGFTYWNRELVDEIARSAHVSAALMQTYDEHHDPILLTTYRELLSRQLNASAYFSELIKIVHTIASHGGAVLLGRGIVFMLPPERVLRVRLVCPLEQRISRLVERHGVTTAAARAQINATDAERRAFVKDHLDGRLEVQSAFDLHVNTGSYGVQRAAEVVVAAYKVRFGEAPAALAVGA